MCIQFCVFQPTATQSSTPVASTAPVRPSVPTVVCVLFDEHASTAPIAEQVAQAEATAEPVVETAEPEVESETSEEAEDLVEPVFEEEAMDDVGEMVEDPAPSEFAVEQFMEIQRPESHYVVTFEIDQRDADDITVSNYQTGELSKEELIKLSILAHYNQLSDYDGGWWSLRPLDDFLEEYLQGNFYDRIEPGRFQPFRVEFQGHKNMA